MSSYFKKYWKIEPFIERMKDQSLYFETSDGKTLAIDSLLYTAIDSEKYNNFRDYVNSILSSGTVVKVFLKDNGIWLDGTFIYNDLCSQNPNPITKEISDPSYLVESIKNSNTNPVDKREELKETDYIYLEVLDLVKHTYDTPDGEKILYRTEDVTRLVKDGSGNYVPETGVTKEELPQVQIAVRMIRIGAKDTAVSTTDILNLEESTIKNTHFDFQNLTKFKIELANYDPLLGEVKPKDIKITSLTDEISFRNTIFWLNGYFVNHILIDEKTVFIKNGRSFLSRFPISETEDVVSLMDINAFQWENVVIKYQPPLFSSSVKYKYMGKKDRKYNLDIINELHFGKNIDENHLLLCNGVIVDSDRYTVKGQTITIDVEKEFIYIQDHVRDGLKEFGVKGSKLDPEGHVVLDSEGKPIIELVTRLYPVFDVVQKHVHSELDYTLITFESSDALKSVYKKVVMKRSSANRKNHPYPLHVTFPDIQGDDLVVMDGVYEPFEIVQIKKQENSGASYGTGVVKYNRTVYNYLLENTIENFIDLVKIERIFFTSVSTPL